MMTIGASGSFKMIKERMMVMTMLDLSIGTTLDTSPSWMALKKHSHDKPVVSPERIMKIHDLIEMSAAICQVSVIRTTIAAIIRTTTVRTAVPRFESTFVMPILAKMEVKAANTAANRARIMVKFIISFTFIS